MQSYLRWTHLVLLGITMAGAAIRVWQARESLWLDELHTAWAIGGDLGDVAPRAAIGNQSPLFFWIEWLLVRLFGASELSLRLPSLVAGSLLPAALFFTGWRWTKSDVVGLLAAALTVVDPKSIFYATEARPYACVELLAVVHILLLVELLNASQGRRRQLRVAWVLIAAALFYLHYTTALFLTAELIVVAVCKGARHWWIDWLAVAALCLPALPNLLAIYDRRDNWAAFIQPQPAWMIFTLLPWSLAAVVVAAGLARQRSRPLSEANEADHLRLLPALVAVAWLLIPVALAWVATSTGVARLFFARYLMASAPAALLLAAMCAAFVSRGWPRGIAAVVLAGAAVWSSGIVPRFLADGRFVADRREDWRTAVVWLNAKHAEAPLPVLVRSGLIEADGLRQPHEPLLDDYCLLPVTGLYQLNVPRGELVPLPSTDAGRLSPKVARLIHERGGAWVVVRGGRERAHEIEQQLLKFQENKEPKNQRTEEPKNRRSFGNVHVLQVLTTDD